MAETPQRETTPFNPRSPYGAAKVGAHAMTRVYREAYGLFACNGILFNHESPRRGPTFVTRKITMGIAQILAGEAQDIYLGNLDAMRDWGYAPEYLEAVWLILQRDEPDDYVIATGETHSVREFLDCAFCVVGLDPADHVHFDARYLRPAEVDLLCGDASKARAELGWAPRPSFVDLVRLVVGGDLRGRLIKRRAEPHAGLGAIPGGRLIPGESLVDAATRKLVDETGVRDVFLEQLYTFDDLDDVTPGGSLAMTHFALVDQQRVRLSDRKDWQPAWFSMRELPELAFQNEHVLAYALEPLRHQLQYHHAS